MRARLSCAIALSVLLCAALRSCLSCVAEASLLTRLASSSLTLSWNGSGSILRIGVPFLMSRLPSMGHFDHAAGHARHDLDRIVDHAHIVGRRGHDIEDEDHRRQPGDRNDDHRDLRIDIHGSHLNLMKMSQTKKP